MDQDRELEERRERWSVLHDLEEWIETPMLVLSVGWLALFVVELTHGLSPVLEGIGWAIWAAFVLEFGLRLVLAPGKGRYLRANVLTAVSLVVPALRIFRVLRVTRAARLLGATRAVRGARLVKVVGALNRGMRSLGATFARRGFAYVAALSVVVVLAGAAGILSFERHVPGSPLRSYADAVWWTAMLMTTMGSDYFPRSGEARILCVLIALYAFAVFGYVTATLATFFVDRDAADARGAVADARSLRAVRDELRQLRLEMARLAARQEDGGRSGRAAS